MLKQMRSITLNGNVALKDLCEKYLCAPADTPNPVIPPIIYPENRK